MTRRVPISRVKKAISQLDRISHRERQICRFRMCLPDKIPISVVLKILYVMMGLSLSMFYSIYFDTLNQKWNLYFSMKNIGPTRAKTCCHFSGLLTVASCLYFPPVCCRVHVRFLYKERHYFLLILINYAKKDVRYDQFKLLPFVFIS